MVQNFHLVWLDGDINEVNDENCRSSIMKLRQVVSTVNTFIDVDECIDFITDVQEEAFMIISGPFSQIILSIVQNIPQINSIYIYSENSAQYEKTPKVVGVYTDITSICEVLEQAVKDFDYNLTSISFLKPDDAIPSKNLDQLDSSFMYTQLLKEILLTIDFEPQHFQEFLTFCRERFAANATELNNVDKIGREYFDHRPIWWYTHQCFLYSMLNRALRTMEVDLIVKMGFFVKDLHNHIAELHAEQYRENNNSDSFTVYRGQGLSQTDFDQLKNTQGGLLAFNNFLSTSQKRDVSLKFAERTVATSDLMGVLFVMNINPSLPTTLFANIKNVSKYQREEEILFSMHSVFRIGKVEQIEKNNRLWQVELMLTSDNDPHLQALTERMRDETEGSTGLFRLARLMMTLAQYDRAHQVFDIILHQTTGENYAEDIYHYIGWIKIDQGKYTEALSYYEKALEIKQKILPANHPRLASCYNNIGLAYDNMGEYSKALSYFEKTLEIKQKNLPANHPDLATSYNDIGLLYSKMGEYSKALSYYEKDLEISGKTLPANHPDLAASYNNIGLVHSKMGEYSKALSYYEKDLEISEKTLPANHPSSATCYNNIGGVYDKMGEHSKAFSYYEKALGIREKSLPVNHPLLATSYSNIGGLYYDMGEYSKALSYYEKDLEISGKTLPANHPDLTTSYNNIGLVYFKMGEHSKALSYYEKALEIGLKSLPVTLPDLATSYNNIGALYCKMGEYSKALSYYERALNIFQHSLPSTHPHLKAAKASIESIKKKL
jgi:tetratricopeptide (TPR) repeat protein